MGQEPSFAGATWDGISDDAKDFVQRLLNKCASLRRFVAVWFVPAWSEGPDACI